MHKLLFGIAGCFCLVSCAVGPNYRPPNMKMPDDFIASSPGSQKTAENHGNNLVNDAAKWWEALGDRELNSLIDRAIRGNPDIEIALHRLQEARTEEAVIMGEALPDVEISGGGGRGTGSDLARGRASGPLVAAENTGNLKQVTQIVGFDAGWELDLFGKYRRELEAAKYNTEAAVAARNSVLISVIADVARAYIDMRGLQMRLAVLHKNIDVTQQYLNVVRERFDLGITNEMDLTLAERQLAIMQAEDMPLIAQIHAAQDVIAVLLGQFPEDLVKELEKPDMIPQLPEHIESGLPIDLLRRRPDIREAERDLAGATARIGVATADLFPHVFLTGGAGHQQGPGIGISPGATSFIWSVGPSVSWSLLDFGTLDALVNIADLRAREMLVRYKQTVLNAVREVDTSLVSYSAQQDRLHNLDQAITASQRAVSLATQRYERGLTDSLNVTDAERQEYELEEEYVSTQKMEAEQFIVLYKALGGGWESYQSFPPAPQSQPAILAALRQLLNSGDQQK